MNLPHEFKAAMNGPFYSIQGRFEFMECPSQEPDRSLPWFPRGHGFQAHARGAGPKEPGGSL
jgi:hypothetical protein